MLMRKSNWLPECLAHLNRPYTQDTDEDEVVTIGEVSSSKRNDYDGCLFLHTALVPLDRVDEVLNSPGNIGWKVESWGPYPCVSKDETYKSGFWITGPKGHTDKLEPIVVSWGTHDHTVMMPDNGLLMCYDLCPRITGSSSTDNSLIWDDLHLPTHGVISVKLLAHYDGRSYSTEAKVTIIRKYLEDFASLKKCAVVAVFYEERWCKLDSELKELVATSNLNFDFPGRHIQIVENKSIKETPILCKIWGRRLVLTPTKQPISGDNCKTVPELIWPDYPEIMTFDRAMKSKYLSDYVCVSDQILDQFEGKPEYDICPKTGSISFGSRWGLPSFRRIGRDYIAYDLKKLYEGCPEDIIKTVHKFAVTKETAERQKVKLGDKHIGNRAEEFINSFLKIRDALGVLSRALCVPLSYEDNDFKERLKELARRAPLKMTRDQFLERCVSLSKVLESLKENSLRKIVNQFKPHISEEETEKLRPVKLLHIITQLAEISCESGLSILHNTQDIASRHDINSRLSIFESIFALIDLRNYKSHNPHKDSETKKKAALVVYEITENSMKTGWGLALDKVYDRLTKNMHEIAQILRNA